MFEQISKEHCEINEAYMINTNCLHEIKEIAEEYHHNKPRLLCNMDTFVEHILQKIAEVENG